MNDTPEVSTNRDSSAAQPAASPSDSWHRWVDPARSHTLLRAVVNPLYCFSAYLTFLFLNQTQLLNAHLRYVQYGLVLWAAVVIGHKAVFDRAWWRVRYLKILLCLLPVAALTALLTGLTEPAFNVVDQVKSAILLCVSLMLAYPLGGYLARSRTPVKDAVVAFCPAATVVLLQALGVIVTFLARVSFWYGRPGAEHFVGVRFINYDPTHRPMIVFGLNEDSNHAALFAIVALVFFFWLFAHRNKFEAAWVRRVITAVHAVAWVVLPVAMILSNSRGAKVALYVSLLLVAPIAVRARWRTLSSRQRAKRGLVSVVVALLAVTGTGVAVQWAASMYLTEITNTYVDRHGFLVTGDLTPKEKKDEGAQKPTVEQDKGAVVRSVRSAIWADTLKIWSHRPVLGIGPYNTRIAAAEYGVGTPESYIRISGVVHNSYLDVLVYYGLAGVAVYLTAGTAVIGRTVRRLRGSGNLLGQPAYPDASDTCIIFAAVFIGMGMAFLSSLYLGFDCLQGILMVLGGFLANRKSEPARIVVQKPMVQN